ncbi:MAG: biopolymer transporter ExbD [Deltaproteobacteria bacterium]|nr:biopolymer transporter ExbD [Deltaproteobacteria bacterium]
MGAKPGTSSGPQSEINVTPLIDIVLVMLIIFMVAVPIKIEEIALNLPKDTQIVQEEDVPEDQMVIAVYQNGSMALNKRLMALPELVKELDLRLRFKKSRVVFVDAHPDIDYTTVVTAMDAARDAGAERVALARMKPEGPIQPEDPEASPPTP